MLCDKDFPLKNKNIEKQRKITYITLSLLIHIQLREVLS